jgi:hypothetical protein
MHKGHADHGAGYQPLDELTKRMEVDVRKEMWTTRLINVEEAYQLALRIEK